MVLVVVTSMSDLEDTVQLTSVIASTLNITP
jgi:hypothetical protein